MAISRRLVPSGIAALMILGFSATPAPAHSDLRQQASRAGSAACAFVADVSVVMDGQTRAIGIDPVTGRLTANSSASADDCGSVTEAGSHSPSTPQDDFGSKTFTSQAPTYTKTDANSTFNAQTNFVAGLPTAFGFKVSPALVAAAISPVTTATATRTPPNCTYNKPGVEVAYPFHWSCSRQSAEVAYHFAGKWVFRVEIGGQTGTATINWKFDYIIYTRVG